MRTTYCETGAAKPVPGRNYPIFVPPNAKGQASLALINLHIPEKRLAPSDPHGGEVRKQYLRVGTDPGPVLPLTLRTSSNTSCLTRREGLPVLLRPCARYTGEVVAGEEMMEISMHRQGFTSLCLRRRSLRRSLPRRYSCGQWLPNAKLMMPCHSLVT